MSKYALVLVLVVIATSLVQSKKTFDRCALVQELRRQGFPEDKLRDWVCLVEAESSRKTYKVNINKNGSRDYGIFQINDKYWCSKTSTPGKDCHVTCASVMTDDITAASACAKKVYARHGFRGWYGWRDRCQGTLPDISSC